MALNFSLSGDDGRNVFGNRRVVNGTYTGPASYATGGDAIAANDVGLSDIRFLELNSALDASNTNPRLLILNGAGTKVMWFVPNTGNEVANATNLSGFTAQIKVEGR
jgi:hypothetical protein